MIVPLRLAARAAPPLLAAFGALLIAGCGSSTTVITDHATSSGAATSPATSSSVTSQSATGSSSVPQANTTSRPKGGTPRCRAAGLSLSLLGQQGATGHGEVGFALRNRGPRTCHTFGYPGVAFLTASGGLLPTTPKRVTQDFFGAAPLTGIDLAPGARASFRIGVTHISSSPGGCRTATGVQVIPPDDTHSIRLTVPNGIYECGSATVSPLRPGASAFV